MRDKVRRQCPQVVCCRLISNGMLMNVVNRTAPGKSLAVSPSSKANLQRGTVARNTFHGKDARRQVQSPYNGPGAAPSHTVDTTAMVPGVGRPSFFNRITQKFSRRSVRLSVPLVLCLGFLSDLLSDWYVSDSRMGSLAPQSSLWTFCEACFEGEMINEFCALVLFGVSMQ